MGETPTNGRGRHVASLLDITFASTYIVQQWACTQFRIQQSDEALLHSSVDAPCGDQQAGITFCICPYTYLHAFG